MDALDRHKKPPQPCPPHKVQPRQSKQTLRELVTDNETATHFIKLLKRLSEQPAGPWREYHSFYVANMSGDTATFKPDTKKFVEKMVKDLRAEYKRQQTGEVDATDKKQV